MDQDNDIGNNLVEHFLRLYRSLPQKGIRHKIWVRMLEEIFMI